VFFGGVVAALVLFMGYFVPLPELLWAAATVALLVSAVGMLTLSYATAKREGATVWQGLRKGIADALRWLWEVAP
jgi:hypothetical protein